MHHFMIAGRIAGREMERMTNISQAEEISELRRRVSQAMAEVALLDGVECDDCDLEYLAFISPTEFGTAYLLFDDPNKQGMITSRREGDDGEILTIESRNITDTHQQRVLLGGVVELLFNLETCTS
jgi:hypothetical protein